MRSSSIYLRSKIAVQKALIRVEIQIVFQLGDKGDGYKKGREAITSVEEQHFYRCRKANTVMLILNNVFYLQSGSHQSSS